MAKSPADRYASAAEVQAELEAALAVVPRTESPARGVEVAARSALDVRSPEVTESPTISIVSEDPGDGGLRLRRRDIDAFERSLRRRKLVSLLIVPAILLAVLAGAGLYYVRGLAPRGVTVGARAQQHRRLRQPDRVGRAGAGQHWQRCSTAAGPISTTS